MQRPLFWWWAMLATTDLYDSIAMDMTKKEIVNKFGTIAKLGTKFFIEVMSADGDTFMIGQMDVGFGSSYLTLDKIQVVSKDNVDEQYI